MEGVRDSSALPPLWHPCLGAEAAQRMPWHFSIVEPTGRLQLGRKSLKKPAEKHVRSGVVFIPGAGSKANRETRVPYYYSADGYAALGHTNMADFDQLLTRCERAQACGQRSLLGPCRYHATGEHIAWTFSGGFQIYLMPALSLLEGLHFAGLRS